MSVTNVDLVAYSHARITGLGSGSNTTLKVPALGDPWSLNYDDALPWGNRPNPVAEEFLPGDREFLVVSSPMPGAPQAPAGYSLLAEDNQTANAAYATAHVRIWTRSTPYEGEITVSTTSAGSIAAMRFVMRARSGNLSYSIKRGFLRALNTSIPTISSSSNETPVLIASLRWQGARADNLYISNSSNVPRPAFASFWSQSSDFVSLCMGVMGGSYSGDIGQRTIYQSRYSSMPTAQTQHLYLSFSDSGTVNYDWSAYRSKVIEHEPFYYWPLKTSNWHQRELVYDQSWSYKSNGPPDNRDLRPPNHGTHDVYGMAAANPDLESVAGDTGWLSAGYLSFGTAYGLLDTVGFQEFFREFYISQSITMECVVRAINVGDQRLSIRNDGSSNWTDYIPYGSQSINVASTYIGMPRPSCGFIQFGNATDASMFLGLHAPREVGSLNGGHERPVLFAGLGQSHRGYDLPANSSLAEVDFTLPRGNWAHVAATLGDGSLDLLVNGELVASAPAKDMHWGGMYPYHHPLHETIGTGLSLNRLVAGPMYQGWIGEIAVWPKKISHDKIAEHASLVPERM